jgi:hypothetical protein
MHTVGSPSISVAVSGGAQVIPKEQFPFSEPYQSMAGYQTEKYNSHFLHSIFHFTINILHVFKPL